MSDTPQNMSGVSTPPDDGNVNTVDNADISDPNSNDQTVPQTAASSTPPTPPQAGQAGQAPTQGATPTSGQPQNPGQPQAGALPNGQPNVKPGQPIPNGPVQPPQNPAVAKASTFHDVAEALAGGPRYAYDVDAYGNMTRKPVPVSTAHLGLALALEALGGGLTGLANGAGPNGRAKAAATAFAQGKQNVQQQDAAQRQQATQDFARRAQVTETNMRMYMMARQIGKMDEQASDDYVNQYKPLLQTLQERAPGYIQGPIKYSDFAKYNVTQENAIPYMKVPRLGPDGKQVTNAQGVPQWDVDYYIVKPGVKLSNLFTPDDLKTAKEAGLPWANNENVLNSPFEIANYLNIKSQLTNWNTAKGTFDSIFKTGDAGQQTAHGAVPTTAPEVKDPTLNKYAESSASKYNVPVEFVKTLISNESSGNANATSPTGVKGPMQVTQQTAKEMGNYDRDNPEQNIEAGTKYFSKLLTTYKDPRLAAAAYYSGPKAIDANGHIITTGGPNGHTAAETQAYVDKFAKVSGLGENPTSKEGEQTPERMTLEQFRANGHPTLLSDLDKFMGAYTNLPSEKSGMIGDALAHLQQNGQQQAANNIAAYLNQNNPNFVREHDNSVLAQNEAQKAAVQTEALNQRTELINKPPTKLHKKKSRI